MPPTRPLLDRITEKLDVVGDCWLWTGYLNAYGYGGVNLGPGRGNSLAHRALYKLLVDPDLPHGLDLDHLCRVRACCNPDHLEPVTRRENLRRGQTINAANAAKTHCPRNHPYDEANTSRYNGKRYCRACGIAKSRERRGVVAEHPELADAFETRALRAS